MAEGVPLLTVSDWTPTPALHLAMVLLHQRAPLAASFQLLFFLLSSENQE